MDQRRSEQGIWWRELVERVVLRAMAVAGTACPSRNSSNPEVPSKYVNGEVLQSNSLAGSLVT